MSSSICEPYIRPEKNLCNRVDNNSQVRLLEIMLAAGVTEKAIYEDNLDAAIQTLRKGDLLAVAGLRGLGGSRKEIRAVCDRLHDLGFAAVDAATQRRSDGKHGIQLLDEAVAALANERRGHHNGAAEDGAQGGKAKGRNNRKRLMPKADAAKIWHSNPGMKNKELLALINADKRFLPYTESTAYRYLKKRQAFAGRRAKIL